MTIKIRTLEVLNQTAPYDFQAGALLLVDKPLEWTSFDVVNKIRYALCRSLGVKKIKVGHAGTLDPLATGLLLICTGKYTKQIDGLQGMPKTYTGQLKLGATTPSYDAESEEIEQQSIEGIDAAALEQARQQFLGPIAQYPPMFSAVKIKGQALYKLARKGKEVERKARHIEIFDFQLTKRELPLVDFEVACSKGTYIRSLAYDFGRALDNAAYLTALRRTKIGDYSVETAWSLPALIEHIESYKQQQD
ncbi:tRNA pseudouridine(55) synthase TruB [Saprospira sp. CCB-QB6]|uniref:tRNA pseudouridine(55) synthase TruB n=1 Tax=Saprospira sp. CCB-QB6 TaxID=3023936 RepID=UPI003FA70968